MKNFFTEKLYSFMNVLPLRDSNKNTPFSSAKEYTRPTIMITNIQNTGKSKIANALRTAETFEKKLYPSTNKRLSLHLQTGNVCQRSQRPFSWYLGKELSKGVLDDPKNSILHSACINEQLDIVEFYSDKDEYLNLQNMNLFTPLHCAVFFKRKEVVEIIMRKQPDLNLQNIDGDTVLHLALTHSMQDTAIEFIKQKCDINRQNKLGDTPLHIAASKNLENTVKMLLNHSADVSLQNKHGNTSLHNAVNRFTNKTIITLLLQAANKHNLTRNTLQNKEKLNKNYYTLHYCFLESDSIVSNLNQQEDKNLKTKQSNLVDLTNKIGDTILNRAVMYSNKEIVEEIIKVGCADTYIRNEKFKTPLECAVALDKYEIVEYFLDHDKNLANIKDIDGNTPLHIACENEYIKIIECILEALKNSNGFIDEKNNVGFTALQCAAYSGQWLALNILVKYGADVFVSDEHGNNILHNAVKNGNVQLVKHLMDVKHELSHVINLQGDTPLHLSLKLLQISSTENNLNQSILRLLSQNNKKDNIKMSHTRNSQTGCFKNLAEHQLYVSNLKKISLILSERKCNINIQNNDLNTCLHLALECHCIELTEKFLLNKDTRVDIKNKRGQTSLHLIAENNLMFVMKNISFDRKIFSIENANGETAIDIAKRLNYLHMAEIILYKCWGIDMRKYFL